MIFYLKQYQSHGVVSELLKRQYLYFMKRNRVTFMEMQGYNQIKLRKLKMLINYR